MEIKITVILNQDGKMNVESNLNPLATARLLGDAQGIILETLLEGIKTKKQATDIKEEIEDKTFNRGDLNGVKDI